ncbi:MAG TPA: biopolymer transporter ExbD [Polyangiaceae bacterium]|jgi:biopolymer transport protein ExbD|nr:MAG: Biopolymer transport protein ExbD/TolR [Deltaproteobacteria bacterium ADurb.Bin207]HNS99281.1 biopolymer transporter ExbD [Polyangiaceae bacterium]HNZ24427.1 biopolymer transporter ExbD [Polyangiaceae bacterium]HOD22490.1 biopolymer transporter ExbD [Polyangiaceae bacterium]HOE49202.1 biopolymer transporter ExbD [Polyangiaceae bacterium]
MTPPAAAQPSVGGSVAQYKAELRKAKRRNERDHEIDFLNITAMLDMMTIILVFLLKNMASSSASIPQSKDLTLPAAFLQTEPHEEGVAVIVTKSQILVGDNPQPVVQHWSRESVAQSGLDAIYKKSGINDLHIVPLAESLLHVREIDNRIRNERKSGSGTSEAIVIVDETTPYRLLIEVLYTLGASSFGKYHLMVLSTKKSADG